MTMTTTPKPDSLPTSPGLLHPLCPSLISPYKFDILDITHPDSLRLMSIFSPDIIIIV